MSTVKSGDLRHRVSLQRNVIVQDATTGEMMNSWQDVAKVWAAILPLSGREFIAAAAAQSEVQGKMVIRYRDDVNTSMRVVYRDKYYDVLAALPDAESGREHLTLMTSEGVRRNQPNVTQTFAILTNTGGYLLKSDGDKLLGAAA